MVREIVFHLGDRKTGSTAIQNTLARGNIICPDKSIIYPTKTNNHIPLAKSLHTKKDSPFCAARFSQLARQLEKSEADTAVISAEHFEEVAPQQLFDAIAQYLPAYSNHIRLIAYVRPHADRLLSSFAEQIKLGQFSGTLEQFQIRMHRKGTLAYTSRFTAWREVFGQRFTLRPFVRSQLMEEDIVQDFADFVLNGPLFHLRKSANSNPSLSQQNLAMLREFHLTLKKRTSGDVAGKKYLQIEIGKQMGRILAQMPQPSHNKMQLHINLVEQIITANQADAKALDAAFFPDFPVMETALLAARDKALPEAQTIKAKDCLRKDEVQQIRFWAGLIADLAGDTPDVLLANLQKLLKPISPHAADKPKRQP